MPLWGRGASDDGFKPFSSGPQDSGSGLHNVDTDLPETYNTSLHLFFGVKGNSCKCWGAPGTLNPVYPNVSPHHLQENRPRQCRLMRGSCKSCGHGFFHSPGNC